MPKTYEFPGPDGHIYEVIAEDGVSEQQARESFKALWPGLQEETAPEAPAAPTSSLTGAAARGIAEGLPALPLAALDIASAIPRGVYEYATGTPTETYSEMYRRGLDEISAATGGAFARPQSENEQLVAAVTGGLASAAGGMGIGQALANSAGPVVSGVGRTLASSPELQLAGAAGSSAGSELARQSGAGTGGQIAAGLLGGVAGGALVPSRAVTAPLQAPNALPPVVRPPTAEYQKLVGLLEREGVPLTGGQKSGQNWLKMTETHLADLPFIGTPLQRQSEAQRQQFQRGLLRMAGATDDSFMASPEVLARAKGNLSSRYNEAFAGKVVNLDDDFREAINKVAAKHERLLPAQQKANVKAIANDALKLADEGGFVTGENYQEIRSMLGKRAKGSGDYADFYSDLKKSFDDAFERAAGPEKFDIDRQYANLRAIEKAMQSNSNPMVSEGFIPIASISTQAKRGPASAPFRELARAGATVLPDRVGNSGTAQRAMALGALGLGGGAYGVGSGVIDPTSLIYAPLLGRSASQLLAAGIAPPALPSVRAPSVQGGLLGMIPGAGQ